MSKNRLKAPLKEESNSKGYFRAPALGQSKDQKVNISFAKLDKNQSDSIDDWHKKDLLPKPFDKLVDDCKQSIIKLIAQEVEDTKKLLIS